MYGIEVIIIAELLEGVEYNTIGYFFILQLFFMHIYIYIFPNIYNKILYTS